MTDPNALPTSPEPPVPNPLPPPARPAPRKPFSWWLKRLVVCNPFYLVSAALLLYGFYRVSADTGFLREEAAQLAFNLSSLQAYELLLVATAIFLARRRVWYDSTLLVCLENLLVLVPFILITQAALIDLPLVWVLSLAAASVALLRFGSLKRFIAPLNFPRRLVPLGLLLLATNTALPIVYRILEQSKLGTRPDFGAAYYTNQCAWLLVLPMLCALANLLPPARDAGDLLPQRGRLPGFWFSLWLAGTVVHLYCLGYIYEFALSPKMTAPAVWVLLWSFELRASRWVAQQSAARQRALLAVPLLAPFLGWSAPANNVFLALALLNAAVYAGLFLRLRKPSLVLPLFLFCLMALVAGFPEPWGTRLLSGFSRGGAVAAALTGYVVLGAALSRSPKLALGGALTLGSVLLAVLSARPNGSHWALELPLVFLLLHSLRWEDARHVGSSALRLIAGALWVLDAGVWMHSGGRVWPLLVLAGMVFGAYLLFRWLSGRWGPLPVPLAAALALLTVPGNITADKLHTAPPGLLAVVGSFLLFGLGTLVAVSRRRWLT